MVRQYAIKLKKPVLRNVLNSKEISKGFLWHNTLDWSKKDEWNMEREKMPPLKLLLGLYWNSRTHSQGIAGKYFPKLRKGMKLHLISSINPCWVCLDSACTPSGLVGVANRTALIDWMKICEKCCREQNGTTLAKDVSTDTEWMNDCVYPTVAEVRWRMHSSLCRAWAEEEC